MYNWKTDVGLGLNFLLLCAFSPLSQGLILSLGLGKTGG